MPPVCGPPPPPSPRVSVCAFERPSVRTDTSHPTPIPNPSLDTSEWTRNGDYNPSRIDAQYDAATMIVGAKLDANAESTVGVLTMGGTACVTWGVRLPRPRPRHTRTHPTHPPSVRLLSSPTEDLGKLLACLHGLTPGGPACLTSGLKTAMVRCGRGGGLPPLHRAGAAPHSPPLPHPSSRSSTGKTKTGGSASSRLWGRRSPQI